ncbi:MAG: hypothetical protein RLZZ183_1040, partial [Actinomycetota bacterium]
LMKILLYVFTLFAPIFQNFSSTGPFNFGPFGPSVPINPRNPLKPRLPFEPEVPCGPLVP